MDNIPITFDVKLIWNEPNQRWLLKIRHPIKGRWFQFADMAENPWDCMTINHLTRYELDKNIDNEYVVTIKKRGNSHG